MNMKMRRVKMRRGFMCQSPGSTAVMMCQSPGSTAVMCMTGDPRSVIVPRRPDRTLVDRAKSLSLSTNSVTNAKYVRLVDQSTTAQRLGSSTTAKVIKSTSNSVPMPVGVKRRDGGDHKNTALIRDIKALPKPASVVLPSSADQVFQVVVMRVSLHCQGCAGKVKKHISKMEGVTSFSIDLESKRVTVMGHVSPVGVLESISKVKRAEFWPC